MNVDKNDPRLTAYALGEAVDPQVAAAIEASEELRAEAAAIREASALVLESLQLEATAPLTDAQRDGLLEQALAGGAPGDAREDPASESAAAGLGSGAVAPRRGALIAFPRPREHPIGYAIAAGLLVFLVWGISGIRSTAVTSLHTWQQSVADSGSQDELSRAMGPERPMSLRDLVAAQRRAAGRGAEPEVLAEAPVASADAAAVAIAPTDIGGSEPSSLGMADQTVADSIAKGARAAGAPGEPAARATTEPPVGASAAAGTDVLSQPGVRKIVKDGSLIVEVKDVRSALGQLTAAATELGGYVLDVQTSDGGGEQASSYVTVAVPVDNFEAMLERARRLAVRIIDEQASGRDATKEYVDLQSQIANLEATQARIRQFLDQARSIDEAMRVNAQLTEIEGQISLLKGQAQYLGQRAAYSTVSVRLLETALPATPTPTPTATPTPVPAAWNPGDTANDAFATLSAIVRVLGDVGIWLAIVVLPFALPAAIVLYAVARARSRQPLRGG